LTSELADRLAKATSVEAFWSEQGALDWPVVASLKGDVDHLVGSDLRAAGHLASRIQGVAELLGDGISRAFADASRARVLHHEGRHQEANRLYERAIGVLQSSGLAPDAARIQKQQVDALMFLGRYQEALSAGRAARRHLRREGPVELAQLEMNVGNVYYHLDRYSVALSHYDRARTLLSEEGDDSMRALVDLNRSNIFIEMDRPAEALKLLESVGIALSHAGKGLLETVARSQIAYLQYLRGNYNSALASYYQARDRLIELGSTKDIAFFNLDIAEVLLSLSAFDEAETSAEAARSSFEEMGMTYQAARATMLASLSQMPLKRFDQARAGLAGAREVFRISGNKTFAALTDSYLAEVALRSGDPEEAAQRAKSALTVFARQKLLTRSAMARLHIANALYQKGELAAASRMSRSSLATVSNVYAPGIAYRCHHLIGRGLGERGLKRQALDSFRRAVAIVEQMRGGIAADEFKASFLRDKIEVYEDAIRLCLEGDGEALLDEAFHLVESSKSRALADLLARYVRGGEGDKEQSLNSEDRARLSKLIEDLNWYSSNAGLEDDKGGHRSAQVADRYRKAVSRCERQIVQLVRRMEAEGPALADIRRLRPATSVDLRQSLNEGETAIEYFTAGDEISAFIATREKLLVARSIASKRSIEKVLSTLRFQIDKFNYGPLHVQNHFGQLKRSIDEHLSSIYRMVFQPLESKINSERIIIIPHGPLHYVPFHALRQAQGYIVDRFEVSYAPSAAVLKICRTRGPVAAGETLVAVGVAEPETPAIEDELTLLQSIFPDTVKLSGSDATLDNLLKVAPRARFLHLASHGNFRRDNPMFSFLKLWNSRLDFYSLLDLKLNAEMVTLSACRTGVNAIFPGDELHGLMRGFLHAGARSLVVSLWAVSDRSTAELMGKMYAELRAGASKRAALRKAQLAIKDEYGHPFYWAPFILMGEPV
jgi:CHAT domain-containing protein